jgi:hypothetical protein
VQRLQLGSCGDEFVLRTGKLIPWSTWHACTAVITQHDLEDTQRTLALGLYKRRRRDSESAREEIAESNAVSNRQPRVSSACPLAGPILC